MWPTSLLHVVAHRRRTAHMWLLFGGSFYLSYCLLASQPLTYSRYSTSGHFGRYSLYSVHDLYPADKHLFSNSHVSKYLSAVSHVRNVGATQTWRLVPSAFTQVPAQQSETTAELEHLTWRRKNDLYLKFKVFWTRDCTALYIILNCWILLCITLWHESVNDVYPPSDSRLSAKLVLTFCGYRMPRGQRDGSLRPYSRFLESYSV
jgi:hypothetical protein